MGKGAAAAVPPTVNARVGIEYSVHLGTKRMIPELERVFPGVELASCFVVPTFQECKSDMVSNGDAQDREKDELLENFVSWARGICVKLREMGHWADLTDPCSGYPVLGERGPGWYPDVIGSQMLLGYDVIDTGCCKLLAHPKWQTKVYPATLFSTAPLDVLAAALSE